METIVIANPIYDTVFKHLMENTRVARFFVETIINQPVERIAVTQQERTYLKMPPKYDGKELTQEEVTKIAELMSVLRYDYVATIRTPEGYKKVLIEIQKARNLLDIMRFRDYLGEQYKRRDTIIVGDDETAEPLPIITIYLLGFELQDIEAVVVHVSRTYHDVIGGKDLEVKSEFIECLTHDSYIVQIPRIDGKCRSRLEKMLSIFEQNDFFDEKCIIRQFQQQFENDEEELGLMVYILCRVAADPKQREEIELEQRSKEFLEEYIAAKKKSVRQQLALEENQKALAEKDKALAEKDKALEELRKQLAAFQNIAK